MAKYVTVVGAVNIDIIGRSSEKIVYKNSNIGKNTISFGGVGRNISENLSRLNVPVEMITALGGDENAKQIERNCDGVGISLRHSLHVPSARTSTYLCVNDENGDMLVGVNDMAIYEELTVDYLKTKLDVINGGELLVFDANSRKDVVEFLAQNATVPTVVDTVSQSKTGKLSGILDKITVLKPNVYEAEILTGIEIKTDADIERAAKIFEERGVKKVFISCAERGVYFRGNGKSGFVPAIKTEIASTTGAGDAFVAALAFCELKGIDIETQARLGTAASTIALRSEHSVSEKMSEEKLYQVLSEE